MNGDILKSIQWSDIFLVKYIGTAFYLCRKGNNRFNKITTWNNAEKSEIIGNITDKEIDKECSRLEAKEKSRNIESVLINNKMYFIDKNLYEDLLNDIKSNYIPTQKIKDKIGYLADTANKINNEIVEELKSNDICQEYLEDKRKEIK